MGGRRESETGITSPFSSRLVPSLAKFINGVYWKKILFCD